MRTSPQSTSRGRPAWAAILIALMLISPTSFTPPAGAQVSGNAYTSPQFGFSMSWDDTWFVVDEASDPSFDRVIVSNGLTYVTLIGGPDSSPTSQAALVGLITAVRLSPGVTNLTPMRDEEGTVVRGGDDQRAFAAFTYTFTLDDGTEIPVATYIESRIITPGETTLGFITETPVSSYDEERPQVELLLSTVRMPNESALPEIAAIGEPAPVFVSGPWRIAVAASAVRSTFPDLGLRKKAGKAWLVAVLDVTNWSEQDAELSARDFTIQTGAGQKPSRIARSSMPAVADTLGTTPFADDLALAIDANRTARVALAFVIPADTESPLIAIGTETLPLAGVITSSLRADDLPAAVGPSELVGGTIISASDGHTLRITLDGAQRSSRFLLLGVNPPADGSCFADAAESTLDDLAGTSVLVEEDAAITEGSVPSRYLWLVNDDGTRTLLNQRLLAEGSAYAALLPVDARFAAWLDATAKSADLADIGLWAGCASTKSDANIGIAATPTGQMEATQ